MVPLSKVNVCMCTSLLVFSYRKALMRHLVKRREKSSSKLIIFPAKHVVSLSQTHMQILFSSSVYSKRIQQHSVSPLASDCCRNPLKPCKAVTFTHTQSIVDCHLFYGYSQAKILLICVTLEKGPRRQLLSHICYDS